MEKKSLERGIGDRRGLENISNLFLSTSEKTKESLQQGEDKFEIEETVSVCKKLAFQQDENVQQNMIKTLSEHIEQGYHIKRVDLQKNEDISKPGVRIRREEEVVIFIKDPVSP
jgi:glycine cleavage system pyridoxal-binding protein P